MLVPLIYLFCDESYVLFIVAMITYRPVNCCEISAKGTKTIPDGLETGDNKTAQPAAKFHRPSRKTSFFPTRTRPAIAAHFY